MTPPLPTAAATSAFCKALVRTSCWPMAEYATPGKLNVKNDAGGKLLATAPGRSIGGISS